MSDVKQAQRQNLERIADAPPTQPQSLPEAPTLQQLRDEAVLLSFVEGQQGVRELFAHFGAESADDLAEPHWAEFLRLANMSCEERAEVLGSKRTARPAIAADLNGNATITMRDRAVELARQGFPVFPLVAGTKDQPAIPDWMDRPAKGEYFSRVPSSDPDRVYTMWTEASGNPLDYNIGICTNNLLVFDLDVKDGKNGIKVFAELVKELGLRETTIATLTPTGGQHRFYKLPNSDKARPTVGALGEGIDTRGWNGYVVAPGSRVPAGEYKWLIPPGDAEMAIASELAIQRVKHAGRERQRKVVEGLEPDSLAAVELATEWLIESAPEAIEGFGGDNQTYQIACVVRDFGVEEQTCLELMAEHWNPDKAHPPWPIDLLELKVASAYLYAKNPLGARSAEADFGPVELEEPVRGDKATEGDSDPAASREPRLPPCLDIAAWSTRELGERDWVVHGRILNKNVALMTGDGGIGKTIVTYELAMLCPVTNPLVGERLWLGAELRKAGPAIVLCCEDDEDEFQRRGQAIAAHHCIDLKKLAPDLHLISLAGEVNTLFTVTDQWGVVQPTKLFQEFAERVCDIKPVITVVDNVADIYGGEEIARSQVRQFVALFRQLAIRAGTAIILNAHPSLSGIKSGRGTSGSTHWHNSVRHRFYMRKAEKDEAIPGVENLRMVEVMKNQYGGGEGIKIPVKWQNGLFVPVNVAEARQAQEDGTGAAEELFLRLLDRYGKQGRRVSDKNYAPRQYAEELEAGQACVGLAQLEAAMRNLFAEGTIKVGAYVASDRHEYPTLVRVAKGA
jgi:RecA-family ATPase